jgi:flagella basal body P-ring formation protein FlgA
MPRAVPAALLLLVAGALPAAAASVVPVRPIRAQAVVLATDLELRDDTIPGAIGALEEAVGLEAKVTLYPGRPILEGQVGPPALVQRNQTVRMNYISGALAISAEGRALDRGGVGETIRVMNLGSKQIVTGDVAADGTIEVTK